jgi:hypothetical protein
LHSFFYYEIPSNLALTHVPSIDKKSSPKRARKQSLSVDSKLTILCSMIKKKVQNILVIGPRSNKSTLIRSAANSLKRVIVSVYPQTFDNFF